MNWYVYILECNDGTLYTGITTNIERRLNQHNKGIGARYTRGRGPVKLIYTEEQPNRRTASKRELLIKNMSKEQKLILGSGWNG